MCGICGMIAADAGLVRSAVQAMNAAQVHRGPDDDGIEIIDAGGGAALGLGQRRLSIIDLSPAGHQPMTHPESGDVLNYNGELYNFADLREALIAEKPLALRGHSDTEIMLHALTRWGPRVLDRFEGMYAISFYDRAGRRLLLARDPAGIKPLYYVAQPGRLIFASEVRTLLATGLVSREIDRRAVAGLMAYGAVQEPLTIYREIRSLPAGTAASIDLAMSDGPPEVRPRRYWDFPAVLAEDDPRADPAAAVESLRATLDRAVKNHLISDRPVGIFLSSGLDSTIIAGLARRHAERVRTFTVGFSDNPDMSETAEARRTAEGLGVEHTEIEVPGPEAEGSVLKWMDALDQPSLDGLNTYIISGAVRRAGIVVALSGLGGDELLGGYRSFNDVPRFVAALRRGRLVPAWARGRAFELAATRRGRAVAARAGDVGRSRGGVTELALLHRRVLSEAGMRRLGLEAAALGLHRTWQPPEAIEGVDDDADRADVVAAISRCEARYYMGNMLLHDSDTNGMAHSLEIRVPMIDRRMLDLCSSLPGRVRLPEGVANKHLLRAAFPELLRRELLEQRKRTFTLPIRRWMRGPLRPACLENLAALKRTGLMRREGIEWAWREFEAQPETPAWTTAFTLAMLGGYLRRMGVT